MKIRLGELKRIVQSVISEAPVTPDVGKEIKGSAASDKAVEKLEKNPAIVSAMDKITDVNGLANLLQGVIEIAMQKGIDQNEIKSALNKVLGSAKAAKPGSGTTGQK
jgi:hypothetical protein